jgi:hypothetical protein
MFQFVLSLPKWHSYIEDHLKKNSNLISTAGIQPAPEPLKA